MPATVECYGFYKLPQLAQLLKEMLNVLIYYFQSLFIPLIITSIPDPYISGQIIPQEHFIDLRKFQFISFQMHTFRANIYLFNHPIVEHF